MTKRYARILENTGNIIKIGVPGFEIMDRVDSKHLRLKMSHLWFQDLFHLHNL